MVPKTGPWWSLEQKALLRWKPCQHVAVLYPCCCFQQGVLLCAFVTCLLISFWAASNKQIARIGGDFEKRYQTTNVGARISESKDLLNSNQRAVSDSDTHAASQEC